ncbi:MAG: prepilin peptidase [Thermoguttaceae bacterium]|nr:prepilin peptidase [Thermoguttaceae bacterium]
MTTIFPVIFMAALLIFTIGMAVTDTIWRKVPNKYTVPFAISGLIFSLALWLTCLCGGAEPLDTAAALEKLPGGNFEVMFTYLTQITPLWALGGFLVGFFILFAPAAMGGVGFGDVKLLAALGVWLGIKWFLLVFVMAILIACLMSVCVMIAQGPVRMMKKMRTMRKIGAPTESALRNSKDKKRLHRSQPKELKRIIPFAIPVALATILFLGMFFTNTFQYVPVFYS